MIFLYERLLNNYSDSTNYQDRLSQICWDTIARSSIGNKQAALILRIRDARVSDRYKLTILVPA